MDAYEARFRVLVALIQQGASTAADIESAVREVSGAEIEALPVLKFLEDVCVDFDGATGKWQVSESNAKTYAFGHIVSEAYRAQLESIHALNSTMEHVVLSLLAGGATADEIALELDLSYEFVMRLMNPD